MSESFDRARAEFQRRCIDVWLTNETLKAPSKDKDIEFYGSYSDFVQRKEASFAEIFNKPSTDTISHLKRARKGTYSAEGEDESQAPGVGASTDQNDSR